MNDIERRLRDLGDRTAREAAYREAPRRRIVRRARLRRALTVGAPIAVVVLFAGVAIPRVDWPGRRTSESSIATLAEAIDATEEAGTARVEMEFEFEMDSGVESSHATGVIDFETGRAMLEVAYSGSAGNRVVETLTDGSRMLERPTGSADGKWHEVDLPPGASGGLLGSEPEEFLGHLELIASEITRVGEEVRDGETMTRYRAILDPAKVEESAPRELPEDLHVEYRPTDVWIDQQGRLREATFGGTVTRDDFEQTLRGTMRLYDFGVEADIELPAPDEITDDPSISEGEEGEELDEFGVGETFTVAGDDGLSGPNALVAVTDGVVGVCIQGAPPATTLSTIVEVESGDVVVSVPGDETETNPYARGGCTHDNLSTDLADQLRSHRERFELRFERADAPDMVVPLTQTF
jgi:hypothetical protein